MVTRYQQIKMIFDRYKGPTLLEYFDTVVKVTKYQKSLCAVVQNIFKNDIEIFIESGTIR